VVVTASTDERVSGGAGTRVPYLGLDPFGDNDDDARLFFGREADLERVIANLLSARVTVLYGPSGVGKSSLLHAGVAHRLRTGEEPPPVVIIDQWSADPTAALADAICRVTGDPRAPADPGASLEVALERLRERRSRAPILILDRFEDYLRLHPPASDRGLDGALAALCGGPDLLVRLLIGIRDDRLAALDRLDGVVPGLFANVLRLAPLSREAALQAIMGPLGRYNAQAAEHGEGEVTLEEGLADEVLTELGKLGRAPAGVPARPGPSGDGGDVDGAIEPAFLSFTMRRLWDADVGSGRRELRKATLESLGGPARIFATHLDETMATLSSSEQRLAAEVMRFMVTPSGAMQRYSVPDLASYVGRSATAVEGLTEKLSRAPARILRAVAPVPGETQSEYELTHQVLARPALDWRTRYITSRLQRRSRLLLLGLVAMTAVTVSLIAYVLNPGPLSRLEAHSVDARFGIRGPLGADPRVVLVPVDQAEQDRIVATGAPRLQFARAFEKIAGAHPRVIASDAIFLGAKRPVRADRALIAAVRRIGRSLVLGTSTLDSTGQTQLFGDPAQVFSDTSTPAAGYVGFPGNPRDPAYVIRTMERSVALGGASAVPMQTLALVTARLAGVPKAAIAALPPTTWINFRGGAGTFPSVPFADVLAGQPAALARLRGKIVLLGVTAPSIGDNAHATSAPGQKVMSGMELQANAISTALQGFPLRNAGTGVDVALIILLGLAPLAVALLSRLKPWAYAIGVIAAALAFCVGAQIAFDAGKVISVVYPLLALALSGLAGLVAILVRRGSVRNPLSIGAVSAPGGVKTGSLEAL
jgi:CHASE2 domain-containing sensor protein